MDTQRALRPFYGEFAWAYDLLIDRPVERECETIASWLVERGAVPGSGLLDAGCGSGRYARELARRGYVVHGIDLSEGLLEQAKRAVADRAGRITFAAGDVRTLPDSLYDAILCRGVLNDLVTADERRSAFTGFGRALRAGGVLVLDVREWEATAIRKAREPLFRKRVETDRGRLTFTSVTELDVPNQRLLLQETHSLEAAGEERSSEYAFVMRCWTRAELQAMLNLNGFGSVASFGAYDPAVAVGGTDRLVVVAQLSKKAASQPLG